MRYFLFVVMLVCLTGCDIQVQVGPSWADLIDLPHQWERPVIDYPEFEKEYPTFNLEQALRQKNWIGSEGEGSCVHASMTMLFNWQGRPDLAQRWRETYENGEWPDGLAEKFDREGVRYAYTVDQNDVSFLEWACNTRRGCGVTVRGAAHMVVLAHLDDQWAGILDNNHIDKIKWVPRETFLNEWFNSHSWAVTPVYSPPPPRPFKEQNK